MKLIVFKWQVSRHALELCIDWSIACLYIQKIRRALQKSWRFRDRLTFIYKLRMRKVILSLNARIRNLVSHKLRKMSQLRLWIMPKSHFHFGKLRKFTGYLPVSIYVLNNYHLFQFNPPPRHKPCAAQQKVKACTLFTICFVISLIGPIKHSHFVNRTISEDSEIVDIL